MGHTPKSKIGLVLVGLGLFTSSGFATLAKSTQNNRPGPLRVQRAARNIAWQIPAPSKEHKQVTVDPRVFDGYVGRYQLAPNFIIKITKDKDHIYAQASGQERFELFPENEKDYFAKVDTIEVSFNTDDKGIAFGLVVHQGGQDAVAKRIVDPTEPSVKARCASIESMVAADFAKHHVGSVTVGVVFGKQLIWTRSFGSANMEKQLPASRDTVYRIGSITKMFTALMLEQLADAEKVHLSDPVEKYFSEVNTVQGRFSGAPPITLIQLATHTSGLDREPGDKAKYVHGPVSDWERILISALPQTRYAFEPGTHFSYSNIGFAILGAALSRASGQPYVQYVSKHIFEPLGMTHTALELSPEMLPYLSQGYMADGGKVDADMAQQENRDGRGYKVPNGAVYTTVVDLARFSSFLMGEGPDSVLKAASLERNLTRLAVQADFQLSNGSVLGGMVIRRDTYVAFGHGGTVAGYQAGLYLNREATIAVIVLANALGNDAIDANDIALRTLDILSK